MTPEEIEHVDREHARTYERDRINERVQIWTVFLTMTTIFGYIGAQNSDSALIVGLFPFLVSCLARFLHDHQNGTDMNRAYLLQQEQDAQCSSGAEMFFQTFLHNLNADINKKLSGFLTRKSFGGNKKALKEAFLVTSLAATYLVMTRLEQNGAHQWVIWTVGCFESMSMLRIVYLLTYWKPIIRRWQKLFEKRQIKHTHVNDMNERDPHM